MTIDCNHCGLPVPTGLVEDGAELQFCCNGCRVAYEVIHQHGLDGYYDIKARIDGPDLAAQRSGKSFAEFDDPAFWDLYCRDRSDGVATVELYLEGVHCAACVWLVEKLTVVVDGVAEVRLDLGRSLATVTWNPETTQLSEIARFLDSIGYAPHPFRGVEARDMARREERSLLIRIAVSGAIAGNVMLIAFALYGGHFHGITDEFRNLFRWVSMALAVPSVFWCANVFYRGAWGALKTRSLHMDLPIAIGILAGFTQGAINTVRGTGEIYFDSVTALIFFLLVGRFLQRRQQLKAASSTELLFTLAPSTARLVEAEGVREVPIEALGPGAIVEVRAGDSIPADGVVSDGSSTLDRSLLTGESLPEPVTAGDPVHAGTVNLGSRVLVEVRATGEDTRVGRLMRLVEEGALRRAPVVQLADRISGWFVALVLALAAITVAVWLPLEPEHAVEHAVALLIVSCPCALGLATPLAVSAAIGRAARKQILIKGGDALENLARPGRMILDKTGTLTEGKLGILAWWGDVSVKRMVAAIERHSAHPAARALGSDDLIEGLPEVTEVREITGAGISGMCNDQEVMIASTGHVSSELGGLPEEASEAADAFARKGLSPVAIAVDHQVVAIVGIGDPLRHDSADAVSAIVDDGWTVEILSGDHPLVVQSIAEQIGLPAASAHGGVTPEQKLEAVREGAAGATTAMVGDGVNDAAALAAATVGIGVHGGAEAALAASDVYLARPGLAPVVELLDGAERTLGVIRRNLVFSLAYNLVAVSFAITGHMSPLLAAILMPLSSMTVVLSSYRARTF
ncbi:MAG: heavy metal translocating P-type ATPase [Acidobacteria bacterium]|jgi:Cu2+-exporting ATPase|nr:heavy metal translocating P-type ATPase [Acidobacteriota bacterium]